MSNCPLELQNRGICVIIPTYNNAGTIVDVVSRAMLQCHDVFVVCDGCTDGTVGLLEKMENKPRIIVLAGNQGKGAALKAGFKEALKAGFAYAITLDADLQHYPEDIPLFLEANRRHPDAVIVGERQGLEDVDRSKGSKFANSFSNFWFFLQTFHYLKDTQTGYRLYPLKKLRFLWLLTSRYEAELELLVLSAWCGAGIVSRKVRVYYPDRSERVSHFRPFRDFARISLLNVVLCMLALVVALPAAIVRLLVRVLWTLGVLAAFVILTMFIITPATFLYFSFGKGSAEHKKDALHKFICKFARTAIVKPGLPGIRYTLDNSIGEDFSKPSVVICNHQSHLDLLPMLALDPKLVIITADWVWHDPIYGYIIRKADYLPASAGIQSILPQLKALTDKGYSVVIYPEGTRSVDCAIGRFHQGAFLLADELGIDILPVFLYGAGKALPKHGRLLRRWPVCMSVGKRITAAELASYGLTYRERASAIRKLYVSEYTALADKTEKTL